MLEVFEGFDGEMEVEDFDELGDALQVLWAEMEEDVELGGVELSVEGVGSLIASVDVMGDELGEDIEAQTTEFLALI